MIQPLAGKIILPKYGGGAQIWCVCLFFFQAILLLGYTIAYLLNYLKPRTLAIIYIFGGQQSGEYLFPAGSNQPALKPR